MKPDANGAFMRFTTRYLPAPERIAFCREVFGHQILHFDIEPLSDQPFVTEVSLAAFPGAGIISCNNPTPAHWKRTARELGDGNDDVALLINVAGAFTRSQRGKDLDVGPDQAVGILNAERAGVRFDTLAYDAVMVPRATLAQFVPDVEIAIARPITHQPHALRLLRVYLACLRDGPSFADPSLARLVAIHLQDLVALIIGATRDGKQIAMTRGVRAARMTAIKSDLAANSAVTLTALAARQRVTPRYVQMLFEEEGTTFTAYALEQRLTHAHRMLSDVRLRHLTIGAIAYQAGFGDLSHFNRSFRRRFGATPSEIRHAAARQQNL